MFNKYKKYILLGIALGLLVFFLVLYYQDREDNSVIAFETNDIMTSTTINSTSVNSSFFVDIKGAVKNPGVYEFKDGDKIIDAINKAGGLTKNAVTSNINLSLKLKSEMVIYIFTKSELTTTKNSKDDFVCPVCQCETIEINNCINPTSSVITSVNEDSNNNDNNLININTATIDELMSLSGIGESKAKAIIEYRNSNGYYKTIDDIKNVSGLGDAIFDKIKNYITI